METLYKTISHSDCECHSKGQFTGQERSVSSPSGLQSQQRREKEQRES